MDVKLTPREADALIGAFRLVVAQNVEPGPMGAAKVAVPMWEWQFKKIERLAQRLDRKRRRI